MKSTHLLICIIIFVFTSCKSTSETAINTNNNPIVLKAFEFKQKPNAIPFYKDKGRKALAINAVKHKGKFASAITTFQGEKNKYGVKLTTLTEIDGESSYKIFVNNKLIAKFQNPESEKDFQAQVFEHKKVKLKKGDVIEVQFNSHSNGKIPEGDAFAFSRGRWKQIEFIPIR